MTQRKKGEFSVAF